MPNPTDAVSRYQNEQLDYSVCTLVTRWDEYQAMLDSFHAKGFHEPACEFLYIDNSAGNQYDAYAGLNLFLGTARGRAIILCHQDIRLTHSGIDELNTIIADMDRDYPQWAVLGNAGGTHTGELRIRITDPHGTDTHRGPLPAQATALDENFLVVRRQANLALSGDVGGYHLYGADLCLVAAILGYSAHVVDFHLHHLSPGRTDASFATARQRLIGKYRTILWPRWITTTCTDFLAGGGFLVNFTESRFGGRIIRSVRKRLKRK